MSWAADRQTTRPEDMAYCLLGIFNVNMPLLYGEGEKAFERLQHEIIRQTGDLSIFSWSAALGLNSETSNPYQEYRGILARTPTEFSGCAKFERYPFAEEAELSVTNIGIRAAVMLASHLDAPRSSNEENAYILPLGCYDKRQKDSQIAIALRKIGGDTFVRARPRAVIHFLHRDLLPYRSLQPKRTIHMLTAVREDAKLISHSRGPSLQLCLPPHCTFEVNFPTSHWDAQDNLFFTTSQIGPPSWCVVEIAVRLKSDVDAQVRRMGLVTFFCVQWNRRTALLPPEFGLFRPGNNREEYDKFFLHVKARDHTEGDWVSDDILYFLGRNLQHQLDLDLGSGSRSTTVEIRAELNWVATQDLCSEALWRATISLYVGGRKIMSR